MDTAVHTIWGKTYWDPEANGYRWLPLWRHLKDSGEVGARLWDAWLPAGVHRVIGESFGGDEAGRRVLAFLAEIHDVGKATPAFAMKVPEALRQLTDRMRQHGLVLPAGVPPSESRRLPHGLASQVILEDWLVARHGWTRTRAAQLAVVIGGHHGVPPDIGEPAQARTRVELLGTECWRDVQFAILDHVSDRWQLTGQWPQWRELALPAPAQVLLTGTVIVADWIASNTDLFSLAEVGEQPPRDPHRVDDAWTRLSLPASWRPRPGDGPVDARLRERFALGADARARPVQTAAVEAALGMDVPGLLVVEAPMGEGKTEAALLAAEVLAERSGAGGCFVALPTQATTDAMLRRVLTWLAHLPDGAASVPQAAHSVLLAHGKSWLNETFRELRFTQRPVDVAHDEASPSADDRLTVQAYVDRWTAGPKKGSLADFVVGTVDQLLFVALKSRHLAMRHLGIARKVVIVDEVHAYDAYMNVYLTRALEWLGAYGVPVVLLSATLPRARRAALMDSYAAGAASNRPPPQGSGVLRNAWTTPAPSEPENAPFVAAGTAPNGGSELAYPALTFLHNRDTTTTSVPASGRRSQITLSTLDDDLDVLSASLSERLAGGGCALVVRNTVARAQATATHLRKVFGDDVRLVHARFIGHDRARNDEWLRTRFGPPGRDGAGLRPERCIVVGTQVVEQSLDVDFDLLVTDLAPTDLLLQRMGRVHRHRRGERECNRPPAARVPWCGITGVEDWDRSPPRPVRGSVRVYRAHTLYRSAALVMDAVQSNRPWRLPDDISPLVQTAYGEKALGPASWQEELDKARIAAQKAMAAKETRAEVFRLGAPGPPGEAILGWLHAGIGEADDTATGRAQVRDSDDSLEVLLLRQAADGRLRIPEGGHPHAGEEVASGSQPPPSVARSIAGCAVRLPGWVSAGDQGRELLEALHENWFESWQRSPALAGQLILPLPDDPAETVAGLRFAYDTGTGLEVTRDGR